MGALFFDGLCDGIFLYNQGHFESYSGRYHCIWYPVSRQNPTSKTEYISCPGCGRTLYDLESTIARIKQLPRTWKGLKIGIMGCIVNGPGEMADADYGYVGAGRGKISLYKKKECIEKTFPKIRLLRSWSSSSKANGDYTEK